MSATQLTPARSGVSEQVLWPNGETLGCFGWTQPTAQTLTRDGSRVVAQLEALQQG